MTTEVRGDRSLAVAALEELSRLTPADKRIWMALVLLTAETDPVNVQAMKILKAQPLDDVGLPLALAAVHFSRQQWVQAQSELENALQVDPKNSRAWELMVSVAQIRGNRKLATASLKTLLEQEPNHPLKHLKKAYGLCQQGALEAAQAELQVGLQRGRNPDLLNALADVVMRRNGDLAEARAWIQEALRIQPFNPIFLGTRGELNVREGRLDEAERDCKQALGILPDQIDAQLTLVAVHVARGENSAALALAQPLARRRNELSPEQLARLDDLTQRVSGP
jgi:Tfp pilus assembly protein PilF